MKEHLNKYRHIYMLIGITTLAGLVFYLGRKSSVSAVTITNSPVFQNNPTFNNVNDFGGYARKIVQNMETGEIYGSVKDAADSAGVMTSMMSRHLNGHTDNISGHHFNIIGLGTKP